MSVQAIVPIDGQESRKLFARILGDEVGFSDLLRRAAAKPDDAALRGEAVAAISARSAMSSPIPVERRRAEARVALIDGRGRLKVELSDQEVRDVKSLIAHGSAATFVVEASHMAGCFFHRRGDRRQPSLVAWFVANNAPALRPQDPGSSARRSGLVSNRVYLDVSALIDGSARLRRPDLLVSGLRSVMAATRTRIAASRAATARIRVCHER